MYLTIKSRQITYAFGDPFAIHARYNAEQKLELPSQRNTKEQMKG